MEIIQRIGECADAVDEAAGDRLFAVDDAADIVCYLIGGEHQFIIALTTYIRVARHKAHYALLYAGKVVIGLRHTDDNAV